MVGVRSYDDQAGGRISSAGGPPTKGDPMKAKIPAGRFGRTTEVADLILFLSSSASDMICGQVILLDGGFTAQ